MTLCFTRRGHSSRPCSPAIGSGAALRLGAAIGLVILASRPASAGTPTIQQIPRTTGGSLCYMDSMSGDGRSFVGLVLPKQLARWSTWAGYELLGSPFSVESNSAQIANWDSSVIVGYGGTRISNNWFLNDGYRWTPAGGMTLLDLVGPQPYNMHGTVIRAVSNDGMTTAGWLRPEDDPTNSINIPFRRAGTTLHILPLSQNSWGRVFGLSRDGLVAVGEMTSLLKPRAQRWSPDGTRQDLGVLPGHDSSTAQTTNGDGSVIFGQSWLGSGARRGFRWTQAEGMTEVVSLPGETRSEVGSVSADGSIAVGASSNGVVTLWFTPGTPIHFTSHLQSLGADISGWTFSSAAMSANGTIFFGRGTYNGADSYYRIDLNGPCPADLTEDFQIDDADFVTFFQAYVTLVCTSLEMPVGCPADLNHDQTVDDSDFVLFAAAYDALLCP